MSDRYLIEQKCKKCGEDLTDYEDMPLFLSTENEIILTCPKCKTKTKFWLEVKQKSKIVK